jgi:hypothetical protein
MKLMLLLITLFRNYSKQPIKTINQINLINYLFNNKNLKCNIFKILNHLYIKHKNINNYYKSCNIFKMINLLFPILRDFQIIGIIIYIILILSIKKEML